MDLSTDLTSFIKQDGKELLTDMRAVSIVFEKRHDNVTRTIGKMLASKRPTIATPARLNFEGGTYADANGQRRPMYRMTAKGLSELTLGIEGARASQAAQRPATPNSSSPRRGGGVGTAKPCGRAPTPP